METVLPSITATYSQDNILPIRNGNGSTALRSLLSRRDNILPIRNGNPSPGTQRRNATKR